MKTNDPTERKRKIKNIFKTSKRSIAAILTLFILLGIAGTCVYAASVMSEETTQEFMPMMARGCSNYDYNSYTMNQLKI